MQTSHREPGGLPGTYSHPPNLHGMLLRRERKKEEEVLPHDREGTR